MFQTTALVSSTVPQINTSLFVRSSTFLCGVIKITSLVSYGYVERPYTNEST